MIYKALFPACASFGPMFMVIGLRERTTFDYACAGAGALMTTAALLMLFDRTVGGTSTMTPRERRDQLLYWCAVIVIGVLVWFLTEWVVPWRS
jgi:hypothetical protein